MPDIKPTMSEDTMDRLASLSEQINTSKGFGMMGLLQNEQQQPQHEAAPAAPAAPAETSKPEVNYSDLLEPLNSSLRAFTDTTSREIGSLRNELSSLRQPIAAPAEEAGEVDPIAQKLGSIEQTLQKTKLDTAWERARNSYNSAKQKFGNDFDFSEDDLKNVWRQHIGNNVQAAEGTNWDLYMRQQYDTRRAPKLEKRLGELESELQKAKSGVDPMAAMAAMPRAGRNGAPSPAVGGGIANDFDEDVYRRASARMGKRIGSFAGFNRLLVDEQNKKLLRTAS